MLIVVGMRLFIMGMMVLVCFGTASGAPATAIHVSVPQAGIDDTERTAHAEAIRTAMRTALQDAGAKSADVCVTKLGIEITDDTVVVSAEIAIVISDSDDRIRTFASGTATYSIARRKYRPEQTGAMRKQVVADALDGLGRRVRAAYKRVA